MWDLLIDVTVYHIDLTFVKWFCFINWGLTLIIQGMEMIISPEKCVIGYAEAEVRYAGVTGTHFLVPFQGTLAESVIEGLAQMARDTEEKQLCSQHRGLS